MARHKGHDPVLKPLEVAVGLGGGDDGAAHADGVDGHGGGGHGEAPPGGYCQGHADGVTAPQDDGDGGLGHAGDELRDGKACLHVPAHGVQEKEDACHVAGLLQLGQEGEDVLVFGGFGAGSGGNVAFNLADDGEAVDVPVGRGRHGGAEVQNGLGGFVLGIILRLGLSGLGGFGHSQQPSFREGSFCGFSKITRQAGILRFCKIRGQTVRQSYGRGAAALVY